MGVEGRSANESLRLTRRHEAQILPQTLFAGVTPSDSVFGGCSTSISTVGVLAKTLQILGMASGSDD